MVAGACDREKRRRNRRQSRRQQGDAGAAFALDRCDRLFKRVGGRRAAAAVLIARAMRHLILGGRVKHGRGVINRRIDEALLAFGIAAGGDQTGLRLTRAIGKSSPWRSADPVLEARGEPRRRATYTAASAGSVNPLTWEPDRSEMRNDEGSGIRPKNCIFAAGAGPAMVEMAGQSGRSRNRICVKEVAS